MTIKSLRGVNTPLKVPAAKQIKGVQSFAQFVPANEHKRFDEMIDQTIYITKIEPLFSDSFGEGYKLWFRDLPNAKAEYTAAVFSQFVVPVLKNMYILTHDGKQINLDNPVKATIRKAGKSYRLE